jgi:hypothetical protein
MTYRARNPDLHQEEDLVPGWKVALPMLATLLISAVLVVWAVQAVDARQAELRPSGALPERWLGPRHAVAKVREDLFDERRGTSLDRQQRAELHGYGWVDRDRGIVHIPIQRAIDRVVAGRRP